MKKLKTLALAAIGLLAVTSCTQESYVDSQYAPENQETPLTFTVGTRNMSRADGDPTGSGDPTTGGGSGTTTGNDTKPINTLHDIYDDFSVFALKLKNSTWTPEMNNFKVEYDSNAEEDESPWKYSNVLSNQKLVFWDKSATQYSFYACAPYSDEVKLKDKEDGKGKYIETNNIWADYYKKDGFKGVYVAYNTAHPKSVTDLSGKEGCKPVNFGQEVPLIFTRMNGKVQLGFWTNISTSDYKLTIDTIKVEGEAMNRCSSVILDGAEPKLCPKVVEAFETDGFNVNGETVKSSSSKPSKTELTKTNEFLCLPSVISGSTDIFIPEVQTFASNSSMKLTVTYTFHSQTEGDDITMTSEITVEAKDLQWKPNTAYLYVFKISLDPIIYNGVEVTDYQNSSPLIISVH